MAQRKQSKRIAVWASNIAFLLAIIFVIAVILSPAISVWLDLR